MTLEERVAELERRVADEARLRASVDGDLSDVSSAVRASRHLIQAVAITQVEHTMKLEGLAATLERHSEMLLRLSSGMGNIAAMLDELVRRDGGDEVQR
jgi:chromosome segregation ATPase